MTRAFRRTLLLVLVLLVLAPTLLYLAGSAWLESAGGRQALERELTRRAGLPVRLSGEFDIMLLPAPGVEGTELFIGGPGPAAELVHSREYSVALGLPSLLRGDLQIESIRLEGGSLRLNNLPARREPAAAATAVPGELPPIGEVSVSRLTIVSGRGTTQQLQIDELRVEGFAERRHTKFELAVDGFGRAGGHLRWDSAMSLLTLDGTWSGLWPDGLEFAGQADFEAGAGRIAASWPAPSAERGTTLAFATDFQLRETLVRLQGLEASAGEQSLRGEGCLVLDEAPTLRLELTADELDLDRLPEFPPLGAAPDMRGSATAGLRVDARLTAGTLRVGGAVARQAVLSMGAEPDCGEPD